MLVFYTDTKKITPIVNLASQSCDAVCTTACIKPKSKCCSKYKKKGVNCKRCPLTFDLKAVS